MSCGKDNSGSSPDSNQEQGIYWIGENWSRTIVNPQLYQVQSRSVQKLIHHTAKLTGPKGHGSSIYLGRQMILTNSHVVRGLGCQNLSIEIGPNKERLRCEEILWSDRDVDAALIRVSGNSLDRLPGYKMREVDLPFRGLELAVAGFGVIANPNHEITFEVGGDCQILSNREMRHMPSPGTSPELAYNVWAVPVGCDTSPGDSGAAVVNAQTGDLVGIVFGGRLKKRGRILTNNDSDIWDQMSYIVPIREIQKRMRASFRR
ncbi:MAG: hypothetical protein OHK0056_06530 [Bacteriovoracaceae bacterium]